ncbi:hypothetical protein [Marinomonas sp. BSi20584]|nr:hypothetical protein [Marinomonas sp. BSi20584]
MSKSDYNVIRRTTLSGFINLSPDLKSRYLATCPTCVKTALLKLAK